MKTARRKLFTLALVSFIGLQCLAVNAEKPESEIEKEDRLARATELVNLAASFDLEDLKNKHQMELVKINEYNRTIYLQRYTDNESAVSRIIDQISESVASKDKERTLLSLQGIAQVYDGPYGIERLILKGELEQAEKRLRSEKVAAIPRDRFRTICRLAIAYAEVGKKEKVKETLDYARQCLEGEKPSGKAFDDDQVWLAQASEVRLVFYWTLVQSGYHQKAVEWFVSDPMAMIPEEDTDTRINGYRDIKSRFIALLAEKVSAAYAGIMEERLAGSEILTPDTYLAIIRNAFEESNHEVAIHYTVKMMGRLNESRSSLRQYTQLARLLMENACDEYANSMVNELYPVLFEYETALKAGKTEAEVRPMFFDQCSSYLELSQIASEWDQDLAKQYNELYLMRMPTADTATPVQMAISRLKSGEQSFVDLKSLSRMPQLSPLFDVLEQQGKHDLTDELFEASSKVAIEMVETKRPNGYDFGSFSSRDMQLYHVARYAYQIGRNGVAKKLLDEINEVNHRHAYWQFGRFATEITNQDEAVKFIESSTSPAQKAGFYQGVAEVLIPEYLMEDQTLPQFFIWGC